MADLFGVFAGGDAFNFYDGFQDLGEFAAVDEAEVLNVGGVVADGAGVEQEIKEVVGLGGMGLKARLREDGGLGLEVGAVGGAAGVGEVEVAYEQGIGRGDEVMEEIVAGEGVGGALGVVEDEAVELEDEIVEGGDRRSGDDDGGDAGEVLEGAVAELEDFGVGVEAGEFVEVEFGGGAIGVGKDVEFGQEVF